MLSFRARALARSRRSFATLTRLCARKTARVAPRRDVPRRGLRHRRHFLLLLQRGATLILLRMLVLTIGWWLLQKSHIKYVT